MKKLICYLLVYLFCQLIPLNACALVVGYSRVFDGGGDDCSGDLKLSMHFENNDDVTQGDPAGCSAGDDTVTIVSDMVYSSDQKTDGVYSIYHAGEFDRAELTASGGDIFDYTDFKVIFKIYVDTFSSDARVVDIRYNSSNLLWIEMEGNSTDITMKAVWNSAETVFIPSSSGRTEDEWFLVEVAGKPGVAGNDFRITVSDADGSNPVTDEDDDDLAAWPSDAILYMVGTSDSGNSAVWYQDEHKCYGTSGY